MQGLSSSKRVWKLLLILAVVSTFQSVSLRWGYASEGATVSSRVDLANDEVVRAKFRARLEEVDDLSKQKERWVSVYAGLEVKINEADSVIREMEAKLATTENKQNPRQRLNRVMVGINQMIGSWRNLQELAVRQYFLILKLESIDQSLKERGLSKADYGNERASIIQQISHVEQLRLWENLAGDVTFFLKEIADEVGDLELAIKLK